MTRQVLLLNITRMGDLVQMGALLHRLQCEWPGAAVDLVVDRRFAPVAGLLPHLRHIRTYDFHALVDDTRVNARDLVTLYRDLAAWIQPMVETGYDRVINLTFNKRSGFLASYIGAPEIRGVAAARDGRIVIHNEWMAYLTDMHHHRRFNRFNLVDIYAWGGSGAGTFSPLSVTVPNGASEWACNFLGGLSSGKRWIAVQVGASDIMKAWRPESFGRALARISKQADLGILFIGTPQEQETVQEAKRAYRAAGGSRAVLDAVGRTDQVQLTALLARCRLLLTNDTGPMHLAVAVGTPVVDTSVGHVDFHETGPYGPGHWVVQPDLACAPCGFDQVCMHHACKDHLVPDQIAALCLYALEAGEFPETTSGIRIYESAVDEDGFATYRLRAGREDTLSEWYGAFWRKIWFESFTGSTSACAVLSSPPPDLDGALTNLRSLRSLATRLASRAQTLVHLAGIHPLPVAELKRAQAQDEQDRALALEMSFRSPASSPATIALLRELQSDDGETLAAMARSRTETYRRWRARLAAAETNLQLVAGCLSGRQRRPLTMYPARQSA
jgi:ADP-heptose:LPS heptosyltransferase